MKNALFSFLISLVLLSLNVNSEASLTADLNEILRPTILTPYCGDFGPSECEGARGCVWDNDDYVCHTRQDRGNCERYYQQYLCDVDPICRWDNYSNSCETRGGDDAYNCRELRTEYECRENFNCDWDDWNNVCRETDIPAPMECRDISNRNQCLDQDGCAWDALSRRCIVNPFAV